MATLQDYKIALAILIEKKEKRAFVKGFEHFPSRSTSLSLTIAETKTESRSKLFKKLHLVLINSNNS